MKDFDLPEFAADEWEEMSRDDRPADERHPYAYSFIELRRRPRRDQ